MKNKKTKKTFENYKKYIAHQSGVVAVVFGLMIPVVIGSVGLSVDMAQAYLVKSRLSSALDAAALAAAAGGADNESEIQDKVDAFMEANYPEGRIGTKVNVDVLLNGEELTVTATARVDTSFMKIFGFETMDVEVETIVQREVRGLEVVMILDNTGSMSTNNNIRSLRTATKNFINILFDSVSEPELVKIGLVPYASSVNVGPYGMGYDMDDNDYGDPFVVPPNNDIYDTYVSGYYKYNSYGINEDDLEYKPSKKGQWHGCVLALDYPDDTDDDSLGPWEMYRHDYNGYSTYKNKKKYQGYKGTQGDYYNAEYGPNISCPRQSIVPLMSDQDFLIDAADNMEADGSTLGNIGLVWGWRVLSPEEPFVEGAEYEDEQWDKVALIMTDGVNSMSSYYSAYGRSNTHNIDDDDLDDRLSDTCENMKAAGILVYAVTFDDGVNQSTKNLYRDCATQPSNYHDAPTQDDLEEVFEKIARELSNLYIKK